MNINISILQFFFHDQLGTFVLYGVNWGMIFYWLHKKYPQNLQYETYIFVQKAKPNCVIMACFKKSILHNLQVFPTHKSPFSCFYKSAFFDKGFVSLWLGGDLAQKLW